jgi:hypothetical protein
MTVQRDSAEEVRVMPQGTCENPWNYVQIGFIACAVMVILLLLLRDRRDHPPTYRHYRQDYPLHRPGYPERRRPGGVLILMLFAASLLAIIAVLTS